MKSKTAARARQEPEYQLRHRVTGAAIIAAAAALVVAWLLGAPGDGVDKSGGDSAGQTVQFDLALPAATPEPAPRQNAGADDAEPALLPAPPPTAEHGWEVRVGAFSKRDNIQSMTAKLTALNFTVNTTAVTTVQGKAATRLWLGPYSDRPTAREVSRRLRDAGITGEAATVVRHKP